MEESPLLYISEFGDREDMEEGKKADIYQEETNTEPDMIKSVGQDPHENPNYKDEIDFNSFPCQHCEKHFTCKQGLEQHIHMLLNNEANTHKGNSKNICYNACLGQLQNEKMTPLDSESSVMQINSSSPISSDTYILSAEDDTAQPDKQVVSEGHYAWNYCEKISNKHTNKKIYERRIHKNPLQLEETHLPKEKNHQRIFSETSQNITEFGECSASAAVLRNERENAERFMVDVSSYISENFSLNIDGKLVSTSTCDAEVQHGSSTLVHRDALILEPAQVNQVLNIKSVLGKEIPGPPLTQRRTATPPLLPQIKSELESNVVVSSSSSTLMSLIENTLPQKIESTAMQKERTVFLSPKLKRLLEKQDGVESTIALVMEGQKPCSPVSSVLLAGGGRFTRRTRSPPMSPMENPKYNQETMPRDTADSESVSTAKLKTPHRSPEHQTASEMDDTTLSVEEPAVKPVFSENWPPISGGNSCNQQPLDLSNTVKRNEAVALTHAALDLSLQKKTQGECELALSFVSEAVLKEGTFDMCINDKALMNVVEQNVGLGNSKNMLVTDFIVTSPNIMNPAEPLAEGLVYGLAQPPNSLTPLPASQTPFTLQPASPCTIAITSPHTLLPSAPSLITVLEPPPPISNLSNQQVQVITDLPTLAITSSENLGTLSQSFKQPLNLPGHVFLTDQIALNQPIIESTFVPEVSLPPTITLNDSVINSYNFTSNTVLIECTIALEDPGNLVPAAINLLENTAEFAEPTRILSNDIEQQQIVSVPNPQTVDSTVLMSSIAESNTLSTTTLVKSKCPAQGETNPDSEPVKQPPPAKEEDAADNTIPIPENPIKSPISSEIAKEDGSSSETQSYAQQQSFTKNVICNVCDKLFHSMKELSRHVGGHAEKWPYKCEFCVLLFDKPSALLDHRSSLHGVGKTYVCSACTKEFVYLCNLKQHQEESHPGKQCTYTEEEKGKLRPQNYNSLIKVNMETSESDNSEDHKKGVKREEGEADLATEELFTTMKTMVSDGAKIKGPDVHLGINQHYPSYKPPPFPYHNRSPVGSVASATNFNTNNIPQTFSTAIRCTKCGKSFDNMPELHKHILACANASDKKRYTPKKNPIPLRHFAKTQNGILSANRLNASNRPSQSNKSKPDQESTEKMKFRVLKKRKKGFSQRIMPQRNKSAPPAKKNSPAQVLKQQEIFVCLHCSREFTMRRSRTKHMAVCPKKPKEVKKRKDGGISVTKENNGHLHRGVGEKQASPKHKTRLQTSLPAKRPAFLPAQTVFADKRSKIVIKESMQPKQETSTLSELSIVRTFNPSMRQYSRVQHSIKGIPIKITLVKPQLIPPHKDKLPLAQDREEATGAVTNISEQSPTG